MASLSFRVTTEKSFKESKNLDKKPDWQSGVSAQPSPARAKEVGSCCTALATYGMRGGWGCGWVYSLRKGK